MCGTDLREENAMAVAGQRQGVYLNQDLVASCAKISAEYSQSLQTQSHKKGVISRCPTQSLAELGILRITITSFLHYNIYSCLPILCSNIKSLYF